MRKLDKAVTCSNPLAKWYNGYSYSTIRGSHSTEYPIFRHYAMAKIYLKVTMHQHSSQVLASVGHAKIKQGRNL